MRFILEHGTTAISKLIEWQTRGYWSHAALLTDENTVIEARELGIGVRECPLLTAFPAGSIYKVLTVPTTPAQTRAIVAFARRQIGKNYAYGQVFRFITRQGYDPYDRGKWFCSDLVFEAFYAGCVKLLARVRGWETSPRMLDWSPLAK